MNSDAVPLIIIMAVLVVFSGFFSSAETAFSSLNKVKLKAMASTSKRKKAIERALALSEEYDVVLSSILIGNNLVNIACTSIATLVFTGFFGQQLGTTLSTVVMTIIVLIFGEVTPKQIAKEKAESYAIAVAPIVKLFIIVFSPLNLFFRAWSKLTAKIFRINKVSTVTEEELKSYVNEAHSGGEIDENESKLIRSSIEFDDIDVSDILTPRIDVAAIDKYASFSEISKVFKENNFSRLPVYIDDIDHIVGLIHHRDFEAARDRNLKSLRTILKPVPTVSPDTKISKLLRILQKNKTHLAVVVDEFGGTEGIVTLEDILEELVGEIWDEHDEVSVDIEKISENEYIVDCSSSLEDFFEYFNISAEENAVSTVNGWVMLKTDKIPEVDDSFSFDIIAGLGNQGAKYEMTRHNAGFLAIDLFALNENVSVKKLKFHSLVGDVKINDKKCLLMKPQTFMNSSGEAIGEAAKFYKIPAENVIIISDDISLDVGKIRIRRKGSAGGHNGLKSIIAHLGSESFSRIKVGVGKKPSADYDLVDWVLGRFPKELESDLKSALENAAQAVPLLVNGETDKAMNLFNS